MSINMCQNESSILAFQILSFWAIKCSTMKGMKNMKNKELHALHVLHG